jgi:peroxiredoxin-like protein
MEPFPHHYEASAATSGEGDIALTADRLPTLVSAAPAEFGGSGDRWSPETLVVAATASCFVLTFRAIAKMSRLPWTSLNCEVSGILDRVDRVIRFTSFAIYASLEVPEGTDREQVKRLLERAEQTCLITNSLKAPCHLETDVRIAHVAA